MQFSEQCDKILPAYVAAQAAVNIALRDVRNDHTRKNYADLASVFDAIRKPMADNGLAAIQSVSYDEGLVTVKTRIVHSSGQWYQADDLAIPVPKHDAQGIGMASTYGRRYALMPAMGVVTADDDGESIKAEPQYDAAPIWSPTRMAAAITAASQGTTAYNDWWKLQGVAFRAAAINTPEHAKYKAQAKAAPVGDAAPAVVLEAAAVVSEVSA